MSIMFIQQKKIKNPLNICFIDSLQVLQAYQRKSFNDLGRYSKNI